MEKDLFPWTAEDERLLLELAEQDELDLALSLPETEDAYGEWQ